MEISVKEGENPVKPWYSRLLYVSVLKSRGVWDCSVKCGVNFP